MAFSIERSARPDGHWTTADKRSTTANAEESSRLCVPPGHLVVRVVRVHQSRGRIDLVEATVVPAGTAPRLASSGLAEERLSIVPAPAWVADQLDLAPAALVLKLDRIVRTPSGTPIEWRLTFSPSLTSPGTSGHHRKLRAQNR